MINLSEVREFEPNTIYLEDGQFLEKYKGGGVDFSEGLPHGILDKRYTGVGATTVEIKSPRKSIIVFPFRKLALEKFKKYKDKKELVFYVGTDENFKSKDIDDIKSFVKKNENLNIKFLVVADSIGKVVQGIEKAGQNPYEDYFMALDEVEILQMQSSFRSRLPLCFDYFNKFTKRCFVSATILDFTHEDLKALPRYTVEKYEILEEEGPAEYTEDLYLRKYNSNSPHLAVAKDLVEFYKDKSKKDYKFFIGINSNDAIIQFIDEFEKENKEIKITVIISETGKQGILTKYHGEITGEKLPSNITLSTCIAWSGIDIKEPYFAVAISLNTKLHHHFSFENLIQFFGRCRLKKRFQLIKTLVLGQDYLEKKEENVISFEMRIKNIESLIKYIEKVITYKKDRESILYDLSKSDNPLIYKGIDERPRPNWLLNDLENYQNQIVDDYSNQQKGLLARLDQRYNVISKETEDYSFIEVVEKSAKEKKAMNLEAFIDNLEQRNINRSVLADVIISKNDPSKKVAAYWYLFGEVILNDPDEGIKLTKYYSGFDNEKISKVVLPITEIVLDSLYLCHFENEIWENLIRELEAVCQGKNRKAKDFQVVFKKGDFETYFDSILQEGRTSTNINYFMKHVLGLHPKGKSKGGQTFLIEADMEYEPIIFKMIPSLSQRLNNIPKEKNPGKSILSFNNITPNSVLNERFKSIKKR